MGHARLRFVSSAIIDYARTRPSKIAATEIRDVTDMAVPTTICLGRPLSALRRLFEPRFYQTPLPVYKGAAFTELRWLLTNE